jgi:hypothetical protein
MGLHWRKETGMETAVIGTGSHNLHAPHAYHPVGLQIVARLYRYQKA